MLAILRLHIYLPVEEDWFAQGERVTLEEGVSHDDWAALPAVSPTTAAPLCGVGAVASHFNKLPSG